MRIKMVPSKNHCFALWNTYSLPQKKRLHCQLVSDIALFIGEKLLQQGIVIDLSLLKAAALLHDIDKNVTKKEGEQHPDSAVRILTQEKLYEVAAVVKTHALHLILDRHYYPKTWEQKVLYLADKMVKYEVVGVDKRFELWYRENLPINAQEILKKAYPKVKVLEQEVLKKASITFDDVKQLKR